VLHRAAGLEHRLFEAGVEAGVAVAERHDVSHNGLNFLSARKVEIEKPQGTIHTECIIVSFDYLHLPL